MALTVTLAGTANIDQGQQTTITATVTDDGGQAVQGAEVTFTASRGTIPGTAVTTDASGMASAVYRADFTDANDVVVTITGSASFTDTSPTITTASLTAMNELGITGQIVNMYISDTGNNDFNNNTVIYATSDSDTALAAGSDDDVSSSIRIWRVMWNASGNTLILNNDGSGDIDAYFRSNTSQSLYLVFADGTYHEVTNARYDAGGSTWARWALTDTSTISKMDNLGADTTLLVGVGTVGTIGLPAETGSDTFSVTAANVPTPPLVVEEIDEQFITIGTEDYLLVVDITGTPDSVDVKGHMEGFFSDWDAANGQLRIEADDVTRLIAGVTWDLDVRKGTEILAPKIKYNVIPAAPIFHALPTIHLYRDVPINFDILIENIPPLIIPSSRLLGLKAELLEYGVKVVGVIPDATFASDEGDVRIIVPSETGEVSEMHDYGYEIEPGSPPTLGTPEFTFHGNYGELEFDELTHALGYEWRFEGADAWNRFAADEPVINPAEIEITPGTLNVTIRFPNIANASSYEYRLNTAAAEGAWTPFVGVLANNFITTIIPDLEEGVEYRLQLRVASPWIGSPVSVTVTGGRVCYTLQINTSDQDNQWLYIYHTGHPQATTAPRIKRLLLPLSMTRPDQGALAVNPAGDVFILNMVQGAGNEKALYIFEASTIDGAADGSRLTEDRKNPFPNTISQNAVTYGMGEYEGDLYITFSAGPPWANIRVVPIPTTNGTELTTTDGGGVTRGRYGASVTQETIYLNSQDSGGSPRPLDRELFTEGNDIDLYNAQGTNRDYLGDGLKVIGNSIYNIDNGNDRLEIFRVNPEVHADRYVLDFYLDLPTGLTTPRFLDIL